MIETKIENADKVALMVGKTVPEKLGEAKAQAMDKSISILKARLKSDAAASRFTGEYSNKIKEQIKGKPADGTFKGTIGSDSTHARFVELGRGPGKFPNFERLKLWVQKKLGGTDADVYFIGRSIAAKGSMKNKRSGYESGWAHLRAVVAKNEKTVKKLWSEYIERAIRLGK
jgi:hypothetical protein